VPKFVVAICAPDAAGGGVIVPSVAERLSVSHQALSAPRSVPGGGENAPDDQAFRERSEHEIERLRTTGGVIRDGAAVVLLGHDPGVLRVRLDGPLDARVRQGAAASGQTEAETRAVLERRDAAWAAFHRTFYDADLAEAHWYHMILDSTALDWDLCADLIAHATRAVSDRRGSQPHPFGEPEELSRTDVR
jgi:cytidylate kinase